MHQDSAPPLDEVALNRCLDPPPVSVVTTVAPVGEQQTLYVAASDRLYAVNASDGTGRWCQQVKLTREFTYHPGVSYPPPPRMAFGAPRVANGVVYVCADGYGGYTYAFNAGDGALRWRTPTDGRVVSMPFADFAAPLVKDGIVYNGTYALNEQDGTVLWHQHLGSSPSVSFTPSVVLDGVVYLVSIDGRGRSMLYSLNACNGAEYWHNHYPSSIAPLAVA